MFFVTAPCAPVFKLSSPPVRLLERSSPSRWKGERALAPNSPTCEEPINLHQPVNKGVVHFASNLSSTEKCHVRSLLIGSSLLFLVDPPFSLQIENAPREMKSSRAAKSGSGTYATTINTARSRHMLRGAPEISARRPIQEWCR